jgi:hypothetical protein
MLLKRMVGGIASYIPGYNRLHRGGGGSTHTPRYCYASWMRHLLLAQPYLEPRIPAVVAELGPGDSVGTGLAALLSGAKRYAAFDVIPLISLERNLQVFEGLLELFRQRAPIPTTQEFPELWPPLDNDRFPRELLPDSVLDATMAPNRCEEIRSALKRTREDGLVRYLAPWSGRGRTEPGSVDFVFSQAVLEHVSDVTETYRAIARWMKPGSLTAHTIDFRCHGLDERWDKHWTYPGYLWPLIRGNRPWLPNRQPLSRHLIGLAASGFEVLRMIPRHVTPTASRVELASELRDMTEDDRRTDSAWIIARRSA